MTDINLREVARKAMENYTVRFVAVVVLVGWLALVGSCAYSDYAQNSEAVKALTAHSTSSIEAACAYQILYGIKSGGETNDSYIIRDVCSQWAKK